MAKGKITAPQLVVLRRVIESPSGYIMRMPGGFWVTPETPMTDRGIPSWNATTQTIMSAERVGLLERTHVYDEAWRDNRRLTGTGEAAARSAPVPRLTPAMQRNLADFARGHGTSFYAPELETLGLLVKRPEGWLVTPAGAVALSRGRP